MKLIFSLIFSIATTTTCFSQNIDSLMLNDLEIPKDYSKSTELVCRTSHSRSLYEQNELYPFLGNVLKKTFQSFIKKDDKGSILYFEFESDFEGQDFLNSLLYGKKQKPTKSESEEYFVKGKILVIWSLSLNSPLKKISKEKILRLLK